MATFTVNAQGPDVKPANVAQHNQIEAKVDVAFNGWIYEAHSYTDYAHNDVGVWVSVSKDAGSTWQTIVTFSGSDVAVPRFDIVVTGQDTNNLKLFVARTYTDLLSNQNTVFVSRHNANTGANEALLLSRSLGANSVYDLQLASDYMFPAVGAQPYSIMCAYTCQGAIKDSLHVLTSADGGNSFGSLQTVTTTTRKLNKLDIAYGYSPSASNGRYFLAWEEFNAPNDTLGHILTAKHTTNISLGFSAPTNLDSLNSTAIGKCRNPSIAVSQTLEDNDSASATALIMAECDNTSNGQGYDLVGFYNQKAHNGTYWQSFIYNSFSTSNQAQPCLSFDTLNRLFILTYYDNMNGAMAHFGKDLNMPSATNWAVMTPSYNDNPLTQAKPYPKVKFNAAMKNAVYVWTGNPVANNTPILFDAGYRYRTTQQQDTSICEGTLFMFNGTEVNTEGYYYDTIPVALGDSIVELWVGIDSMPKPTIEQSGNILSTQSFVNYQWKLEGNDIANTNNQNYTATENGNYTVLVTGINGCKGESQTVNVTGVGISEGNVALFSLYPNPTYNWLNVNMIEKGNYQVYISDILGTIHSNSTISSTTAIDVSKLSHGTYIITIQHNGTSHTGRFVKM